jgi:hypothetical protein
MTEIRDRITGPFFALNGIPATIAVPELGAISVPNIRTVVVLPAPFGPRNPNTSPLATLNETSDTAVRPPKSLVRWLTSMAADTARGACPVRAVPASSRPSYTTESPLTSACLRYGNRYLHY